MTKLKVFIDFEAISAPFSYAIKKKNDLPYAYSIGIHKGKKFKTKTTIINFNKVSVDTLNDFIRLEIMKQIKELVGDSKFQVNSNTISFVGWSSFLEEKILSQVFKGVEVLDQAKGKSLSLSWLTKQEFGEKNYFTSLKEEVAKNLDPEFIEKRGLKFDGALAALAGYILFCEANNVEKKYNINIDIRTLVKEIAEYSVDDINKMSFLFKNPNLLNERSKELEKINKRKQEISKSLNKLKSVNTFLTKQNIEITIEELKIKIQKEILELKKEKDNF